MEAALVGVTTGVVKPLLSKLATLLQKEYAKFKSVQRDTHFLRDEICSMEAALEMLADEEELNPQMQIWRADVRELSFDMEDCVDDFMARAHHERHGSSWIDKFCDKIRKLKPCVEIGREIEEIKTRLIQTSERHKRYASIRLTPLSSRYVDPRLLALYSEVRELFGIDDPKNHIIELFEKEGSSLQLKVVSIVGSGGLGKTTLASQVYHTVKHQFPCKAFVSVSRKPDIKRILREIAEGVGINNNTLDDSEKQLIDKLREYLKDKRYFIVIDDIWDTEAWEIISLALVDNNCRSRIITTTRKKEVALCTSHGGYLHEMKPLSSADSKRLFCKRAFGKEVLPSLRLEEACDGILRKCAGLPLAIITISSLLIDQHAEDEWKKVLTAIGSSLAKDPIAGNMTKILSLSYFDLPHNLRTCLLYLSIFPEDFIVSKRRLINRWVAEGFIPELQGRNAYEIGEGYFNDLINRSLIQPIGVKYGQADACRVHDIVLDFLTCKAIEENFITSLSVAEQGRISKYRVRRLSVENRCNSVVNVPTSMILSHVRSLTIFGSMVKNSWSAFPVLRVLDLGDCWRLENYHIANIYILIHLKYLRVISTSVTKLPSKIGELQCLETLDIRGTGIRAIPSSIGRLHGLTHLYVHQEAKFQDGTIGQMHSLEELYEFGVFSYEQGKSLREISQLSKLRRLTVAWGIYWPEDSEGRSQAEELHGYVGSLISSRNLQHLCILYAYSGGNSNLYDVLSPESWCLTTPTGLQKLQLACVSVQRVPNWMSSLGNLRELELFIESMRPEDVAILGSIPTLLVLELRTLHGTNGRINVHGFANLKHLYLEIHLCGTRLEFGAGSMPKLQNLKLQFGAHKMECVNDASDFGIQHLSAVTQVEVSIRCHSDSAYDLTTEKIASLVGTAVGTLANRPTLSILRAFEPCTYAL